MGLGHSPSIPTSGLVFHMDPGSIKSYSGSGTTVTDLSGSGNNGTLVSSPTYQYLNIGRFGFNGTSSYINLGNPSSLKPSVVSACAWVRTTDLNRQSMIVDGNFQNSGQGYLLQFNASNQALFACRLNNSTFNSASGTTSVAANTWYHVVGTYDGTTIKVYVNGVLEGSTAYSGGIGYSSANLAIGVYQSLISGYSLNGYVGPVQIYNRAITAAEVAQIYAAGSGRYASANSYYPPIMAENLLVSLDAGNPSSYSGSGTAWNDLSGNGNNATLVNSPTFDSTNGGSFVFNRTTNYATLPFTTVLTNCTFNFWFKATSTASYQYLLSLGNGSTTSYALHFDMNDPDLGATGQTMWVYWNSGGTPHSVLSRSGTYGDFQDSTWRNYCFVRNNSDTGTVTRHYVNGVERTSGVTRNGEQTTQFGNGAGYNCRIGVFHNAASSFFGGNIAAVQIYNAALTPTQIFQNFNALRGRFGL